MRKIIAFLVAALLLPFLGYSASDALIKGGDLYEAKQFNEALQQLNAAIEQEPKSAEAYYIRSKVFFALKQKDSAMKDLERSLNLDPDNASARNLRGYQLVEAKKWKPAIKDLTAAIKLKPAWFEPYMHRGRAYAKTDQPELAIADFTGALELNPKTPAPYLFRGDVYREQNEDEKAIEDYNRYLAARPDETRVYSYRGLCYQHKDDYDNAIKDFSEAIRRNPKEPLYFYQRGETFENFKKYPEAIADYTEAIRLAPRNTKYIHARGYLYVETLREYEKAREDFTDLIGINPDFKGYYHGRAFANAHLHNDADAIRDYLRIIRIAPKDAEAYARLAGCYSRTGKSDEAVLQANKALELDANNETALFHRGNIRAQNGDDDGAISDLKRYLDVAQPDVGAIATLCVAYFAKSDYRSSLNRAREGVIYDSSHKLAPYLAVIGYFAAHRVPDVPGADQLLNDAVTPSGWPAPILQYVRGTLSEEKLFDLVTDKDKQTEAHCYTGLMAIKLKDRDSALRHFSWIVENGNKAFLEYRIAKAELDRLKGDRK